MVPGPRDAARALGHGTLQHFRHGGKGVLLDAQKILRFESCITEFGPPLMDLFTGRRNYAAAFTCATVDTGKLLYEIIWLPDCLNA